MRIDNILNNGHFLLINTGLRNLFFFGCGHFNIFPFIHLLQEPDKIIDILIIGAIIEARSCERFLAIIPYLSQELQEFYTSLVRSEARHFITYLDFAREISTTDISQRVTQLLEVEKALILEKDQSFRFHSGIPFK